MCFPYWWCTKHAQLIMGTWPIYKKTLPTNDLNKKNFHLIKYLLTTFIFFPFFSIFTCVPFTLFIRLINCWDFMEIWYDNKTLSSQWDDNNQHFVYIIVSWYLLGIITCQGFLFSCSCMNRCTCTHMYRDVPVLLDVCMHTRSPFHWHGLTLIPAWINNHMHSISWDGITYPFPNFNACAVEFREWISNFTPHYIKGVITYP